MKISPFLAATLMALTLTAAFGQTPAQPASNNVTRGPEPAAALTRFDLDFPGGTPRQLVAAIQKAMGKPVNVIVPDEFANVKLPPLKMNNVDALELFEAIGTAGRASRMEQFGFIRSPMSAGEGAVWSFYASSRPMPAKVCRFYSLSPLLERGLSVDDITTAIQTGWKMLEEENPPKISFHKDTKLLIAVGEASKLETIDAALAALAPGGGGGEGFGPPPGKEPKSRPPAEKKSEK